MDGAIDLGRVRPLEVVVPRVAAAGAGLVLGVTPLSAEDLAAPLPPIHWISSALQWGQGRPCFAIGYSGSCKSLAMLSAGIAAAAGKPIWGQFFTGGPRRVRYVSADSSRRAAQGRAQRIALGMGFPISALAGRFDIVPHPRAKLSDPSAREAFAAAADGIDLLVIDAMRGMLGRGITENDSEIRDYIDPLTEVSDATGATIVLVHHEGKGGADGRKARPDDEAARGSAGIMDAAGSVLRWIREADTDGNTAFLVRLAKSHEEPPGPSPEPFYLVIRDVEVDGDPRAGLTIEYRTAEQVHPPVSSAVIQEAAAESLIGDAIAILRYAAKLHASDQSVGGIDAAKAVASRGGKGMGHGRASTAVAHLHAQGFITAPRGAFRPTPAGLAYLATVPR